MQPLRFARSHCGARTGDLAFAFVATIWKAPRRPNGSRALWQVHERQPLTPVTLSGPTFAVSAGHLGLSMGGDVKRLVLSVAAMLAANIVVVNAEGRAQKGYASASQLTGSVHVVFSSNEVRLIREYYAPRYRALPPGLQKKYARTGQLPPGWQKKLQPFDPEVERRLVALPAGYRRGIVDGRAVIMDDRTHVMIDMAVVF
jgi:hypothetical protein